MTNILTIAGIILAFYFISTQAAKKVKVQEGKIHLKPNLTITFLACSCTLFSAFFIYSIFTDYSPVFLVLLSLSVWGMIVFLFITIKHRVIYDNDQITIIGKWGRKQVISYSEISTITHNSFSGVFIIHSKSGEKLIVNQLLIGITDFLWEIRRKTGLDVSDLVKKSNPFNQ